LRLCVNAFDPLSTYCYQRDLLAFMVAGNPLGARIERWLSIDEELVMVMAVIERNLDEPRAIRLAFHRMRGRIPIVEIAHQMDVFGLRGDTNKVDRLGHFLGGVAVRCEVRTCAHANIFVNILDPERFSKIFTKRIVSSRHADRGTRIRRLK